jgi:hypothetical protein
MYNAAKLLLRREAYRFGMLRAGIQHRRSPMRDPFFGFPRWKELESHAGIRSAFYLFVLPQGIRRHFHDSRSSVTDRGIDSSTFREMARAGWEFGLHAAINARHSESGLLRSREVVEALIAGQIVGLRHHYWALDWRKPWRSFRQHVAAGFRYDTSIAWRDVPGFRAGTSLPFRPFDPETQARLNLWELPTVLQDGHVLEGATEEPIAKGSSILNVVRQAGGVAVLNWHTEAANQQFSRAGFVDVFSEILDQARATGDVWITTPSTLINHWESRSSQSRVIVDEEPR